MFVDQISVFLENVPGAALAVTRILDEAHLNIRALSLCDTSKYGVLRLILDEPDRAAKVLKSARMTIRQTPVLAIKLTDTAGGLNRVLELIAEAGASFEYAYAFSTRNRDAAVAILRVEGDNDKMIQTLTAGGITLWDHAQLLENLMPL